MFLGGAHCYASVNAWYTLGIGLESYPFVTQYMRPVSGSKCIQGPGFRQYGRVILRCRYIHGPTTTIFGEHPLYHLRRRILVRALFLRRCCRSQHFGVQAPGVHQPRLSHCDTVVFGACNGNRRMLLSMPMPARFFQGNGTVASRPSIRIVVAVKMHAKGLVAMPKRINGIHGERTALIIRWKRQDEGGKFRRRYLDRYFIGQDALHFLNLVMLLFAGWQSQLPGRIVAPYIDSSAGRQGHRMLLASGNGADKDVLQIIHSPGHQYTTRGWMIGRGMAIITVRRRRRRRRR